MADLLTQNQPSYKVGDSVIYASTVGTIAEIDPGSSSALVDFYFLSLWIPTILLTSAQPEPKFTPQATAPRDNWSDWIKIADGRHDEGAWHRCISIARDLQAAGKWKPGVELWVHDPYQLDSKIGWGEYTVWVDTDGYHVAVSKNGEKAK